MLTVGADLTSGDKIRRMLLTTNSVTWRIRLVAQDIALSRQRHEFESRMRYQMVEMWASKIEEITSFLFGVHIADPPTPEGGL